METGWNLVSGDRGQNSNFTTSIACDIWQLGSTTSTSRYDYWINPHNHNPFPHLPTAASTTTSTPTLGEASGFHALVHHQASSPSTGFYAGAGNHFNQPDPHLMCLKLGKRHYFEDATPLGDRHVASESKRGKMRYYGYGAPSGVTVVTPPPAPVPRCQVEGCQAALLNAKEYHRRHKVCEMHSKAPKVLVHGIEQRFCQQCSRFHEVSQFDESKRSCRRRLAGHNERRRKSSHDHSLARNPPQENILTTDRFSHLSSPTGCALSLLSSKNEPWNFPSDLSSRCSAALRELIAENRASILGKQFILDKDYRRNNHTIESFSENEISNGSHPDHVVTNHHQILHDSQIWDRYNESRHECDTQPDSNFCI